MDECRSVDRWEWGEYWDISHPPRGESDIVGIIFLFEFFVSFIESYYCYYYYLPPSIFYHLCFFRLFRFLSFSEQHHLHSLSLPPSVPPSLALLVIILLVLLLLLIIIIMNSVCMCTESDTNRSWILSAIFLVRTSPPLPPTTTLRRWQSPYCLNALSRTRRTLHRLQCGSIATLTIHHDKIE